MMTKNSSRKQVWFIIVWFLFFPLFSFAQPKSIEYFVRKSIENDAKVPEIQNLILSNKIDSQLIYAANKLQVTGVGNAYYAPVLNGYGYDNAITNGQQVSTLIALNKQIYNRRNLSLQFESLQLKNDSLNNSSLIYLQDLKKTIISQYILTFSDQLQLNFNTELVALLSKEEKILRTLTQKSVYKQADYLSFLVTFHQQELTGLQLKNQYRNDYAILNYLAGIADTSTQTLTEPDIRLITGENTISSAFFRKYEIDSLTIENNRLIRKNQYRPKLNLFSDAGYQSTLTIHPYKNFGYNVGISFLVPIYDGNQKRLQLEKLDMEENTRVKQREFFNVQYTQQIHQLQQQLTDLENLEVPIRKQINYLETLLKVNSKLLETGDIRITDYVLGLNKYMNAGNLAVQNQIAKYQVIQQLNYWHFK
jgi:hypothetical protein